MMFVVWSGVVWFKFPKCVASNSNGTAIWTSEGFYVSGNREELDMTVNGTPSAWDNRSKVFRKSEWKKNIKHIACAVHHAFVLLDNGSIASAGLNIHGELGLGHTAYATKKLEMVRFSGKIEHVWVGGSSSFVVDDAGKLFSCGENEHGQLGQGSERECKVFQPLCPDSPPELLTGAPYHVAIGAHHVLILTHDGLVFGAGTNDYGELGMGEQLDRLNTFARVPDLPEPMTAVACGGNHSLLLGQSGKVYASGSCSHGQIGLVDGSKLFREVSIPDHPDMLFSDVSCGYDFSVLLSTDGHVFTAGSNFNGQLGIEEGIPLGAKYYDQETMSRNFQKAKVDGVFQIMSGWTHVLLLTRYGLLGCGTNRDNALGLQTIIAEDDATYFMQVPIPGLLDYQ